jgi:polyisoprenyl-teichoic acid--peptidoglycan teichoic acid transferase
MLNKTFKIFLAISAVIVIVLLGITYYFKASDTGIFENQFITPLSKEVVKQAVEDLKRDHFSFLDKKQKSIILLGIDRRSKSEAAFRSDIMIQVIINPGTKKILMISVPRDLWVNSARINAAYAQTGWDGVKADFAAISGIIPENYIMIDFQDFSWLVDSLEGITVNVENTFTDSQFPVDATLGYQTVTFTQGEETLTGDRALIFARSRHGNNGEGSDFMRMKRQHLILKSIFNSEIKPRKLFSPDNIKAAFETIVNHGIETNMSLDDAYYLWDIVKDRSEYIIQSIYLDSQFLYNPPMEDYGGAWVLIPKNNSYTEFNNFVKANLDTTQATLSQNANTSL